MNKVDIHDAATQLAAGRTAYSLARELLGVRAELKTQRDQAIKNLHHFEDQSRQNRVTRREAKELRDTLEQIEAEEGQEIAYLQEQLDAAKLAVLQATANALNCHNRCKHLERSQVCNACGSEPGQYHAPECPAVDAFTAGRIRAGLKVKR
ncbi:hypothetical protein [Billgrantia montanilacus]|uniref:Uncharacterized protein n=1 Tax=Billgrantia montanilacus TaxID=2282305 RepID=A0A368U0V3_9GAMM|nr:hypothetical protein [Halomonas montanilacus]RCV89692.1 hypothetical protein DU505_08805 [Halomonas montanilacus]